MGDLAINTYKLHESMAFEHADKSIQHSILAGVELLKIKSELPHGEFEPWCEANCRWKKVQRTKVMQLAKEYGGKVHSSELLDINTEVTLLKLFSDEQERIEARETMQGMTQQERAEVFKQLTLLKEENEKIAQIAEGWREDSVKYRSEARDIKLENEKLKAEKTKVVYVTEDEAAIKQIKEEAEAKIKAALDAKKTAEIALQSEAKKIADYRFNDLKNDVENLEARAERAQAKTDEQLAKLAILEQQAKRTEAEYYALLGKQERRVTVDALLDRWAAIEGELGVVLAELFFDDTPLDADQLARALKRLDISQQNRDQVYAQLNQAQTLTVVAS